MPDQVLKDVLGVGKRVVAAGRAAQAEGAVHASVEVRQHGGWVQGMWAGKQRAYPVSPQLTKYGCFREVARAEWVLGL